MHPNPKVDELPQQLEDFVAYRQTHLTGDEKGEAALFLENLFQALGHEGVRQAGAVLEKRIPKRDNGGTAYADLEWRPRVLIEMKKAGRDLRLDYRQAMEYWIDLVPDRPAYVVLCNFDEFWIYDLNLQLDEPVERVNLVDLPRRWETLGFLLPEPEVPSFGNDLVAVTRSTAAQVSRVFNNIVDRGVERSSAQRFILQSVMAMFAEDIGLLSRHSFSTAIEDALEKRGTAFDLLFGLFREMNTEGITPGGRFAGTPYFNGGLYSTVEPFDLTVEEVGALGLAAQENWSDVRPAIFGTLFEQSLDKDERHAYGAYFTTETDIMKIVLPTIVLPWRERIESAGSLEELGRVETELLQYKVLDPACGSGNFLYLAYREMRRLERLLDERRQALSRRSGRANEMRLAFVSTHQFFGIDLRPFAVEVAKMTLMLARKLAADELGDERNYLPLDDLDNNFRTANAITTDWPDFDACIGNPPYLGAKRILAEKTPEEVADIRRAYPDIAGMSDYVTYWFRKAHDLAPEGGRCGLVATANIRSGDSRKNTLDYIIDNDGVIYEAVASQPWSGDATVEVAIVNWVKGPFNGPRTLWLNRGTTKMMVEEITGSLSPETDLRKAAILPGNRRPQMCFQGQTPQHPGFVLTPSEAQRFVTKNPKNASSLFAYLGGEDLNSGGAPTRFIIDIDAPDALTASTIAPDLYEHVKKNVLPTREELVRKEAQRNEELAAAGSTAKPNWERRDFMVKWWELWRRRKKMLDAIEPLTRYIAMSRHSVWTRPSIYAFVSPKIRPGDALTVFALEDDYSFGILHSSYHRAYFEERCSKMRVDLRYTSKTVWDTYPWPQGPSSEAVEMTVDVVQRLMSFRDERLAEGVTLEAQYNSLRDPGRNPLRELQAELDRAVSLAYGFTEDEDKLVQLLALNQSIAIQQRQGLTPPRGPGNAGLDGTLRTTSRIDPPIHLLRQIVGD